MEQVYVDFFYSLLQIENSSFLNNIGSYYGGGITLYSNHDVCDPVARLINVSFENNTAADGAAIACNDPILYNCENAIESPSYNSIVLKNNTNLLPNGRDIYCEVIIQQVIFISPHGTDNNECSLLNPCNSLNNVIQAYNDNTSALEIKIAPGIYDGPLNSNIELPTVSVTIGKDFSASSFKLDQDSVIIRCDNLNSFAFKKQNSNLTITDITIENCGTAIEFSGEELLISSSQISNSTTGLLVQNEITIINLEDVLFSNCTNYSISFTPTSGVDEFELQNCMFLNTAGLLLTINGNGNYDYAYFFGGNFTNITSSVAIKMAGGINWGINGIDILNFDTALEYIESSNSVYSDKFRVDGCSFTNGNTAIIFNSNSTLLLEDSTFRDIKMAVNSFESYSVEIDQITVTNALKTGEILNINEISIKDSTFINSGSLAMNETSEKSKLIDNCKFENSIDSALSIISLYSWTISNCNFLNCNSSSNGGGLSINGTNGNEIFLNKNTFHNNFAPQKGGALYYSDVTLNSNENEFLESSSGNGGCVYSYQSTSIYTSSIFSFCNAIDNGGGLYGNAYGMQFTASSFNYCSAGSDGGALFFENSDTSNQLVVALTGIYFVGNTAVVGGEIACCSNCDVDISFVTPGNQTDNTSTGGGPLIACNQGNNNYNNNSTDNDNETDDKSKKIAIGVSIAVAVIIICFLCVALTFFGYIKYWKKRNSYETLSE